MLTAYNESCKGCLTPDFRNWYFRTTWHIICDKLIVCFSSFDDKKTICFSFYNFSNNRGVRIVKWRIFFTLLHIISDSILFNVATLGHERCTSCCECDVGVKRERTADRADTIDLSKASNAATAGKRNRQSCRRQVATHVIWHLSSLPLYGGGRTEILPPAAVTLFILLARTLSTSERLVRCERTKAISRIL